jgi:hypothetical protein
MGSSKESVQTTNTTQSLSEDQQKILSLAMGGIEDFAANPPGRYQGGTVSDFTDAQRWGQSQALGGAANQDAIARSAKNTSDYWLSGNVWDPANNVGLQGAVDAATRAVTDNYHDNVTQGVRDTFQGAGQQFGGSRQNLSEANAANYYLRNVGDVASKVINQNYQTNVNAQLQALGLTGATQKAQTAGAATTSAVGDVQQAHEQELLDAQVNNWNYDQLKSYLQSEALISLMSGIPGGGTTSTSRGSTTGGNQATGALGGAASGAALGSTFGYGGTALGAGLGGLLGYLQK